MNVLHVSAECFPFIKVGGLADVVGSLPSEVKRLRNADVRIIIPKHKAILTKYQSQLSHLANFTIEVGRKKNVYVGIDTLKHGNVTVYFVDNLFYFGSRDQVYNFGDESERFAYFQLAVLEALPYIDFKPDIIHVHDWHTGMIPLLVKLTYGEHPFPKTVMTIHNLAYQGIFPLNDYNYFKIPYDSRFEFEGNLNFLKSGIESADLVTTVSRTYAKEILTDYYGYGLQRLLRLKGDGLQGILNGIDYKEFNPVSDRFIKKNYSIDTYLDAKAVNRKDLSRSFQMNFSLGIPIIAMVTRLVSQKGIDLIQRVFDEMLLQDDFYFIVLGDGEKEYVDYLLGLKERFPKKVALSIGYDNKLAHKIYAGADLFLMPSKFEPCGLSQMIALRYGTIPIVRETGGLADTVEAFNEYEQTGNGFSFTHFNAHDMMHVIRYACNIYRVPQAWDLLVKNAMKDDFSWTQSAKLYRQAYRQLMKKQKGA
ncbi:MAG: glycogen synthase [Acholeplasmataceae bacterium]|nr:glycogen synthase [Acholeplasmataceae bacterium]